jgi:hypothetical protein
MSEKEKALLAWELAPTPSFDYTAWSTELQDMLSGARACRASNSEVLPLLTAIAERDFFSYFAVNCFAPCAYFPTSEAGCEVGEDDAAAACEIAPVRPSDLPPALLARDDAEYEFAIDAWCHKDMPSDFTDYFDLRTSAARDTGYDGSRVWRFIHAKICFTKALDDPASSWKRDYNRYISGMHAAVHAEIVASRGPTAAGLAAYRRRLRDQPGTVTNLYFAYMLTLCALRDSRSRLDSCDYLGDGVHIRPLMHRLTSAPLLAAEPVQLAAQNLRAHAASDTAQVWRLRMRHRGFKQAMSCVQCNLCRVHGTVMALGIGAALQVLLGSDGRGGDPLALDRVQVAALVATAAKLGTACETVERFQRLDVEDQAKQAWLARLSVTWGPAAVRGAAAPAEEVRPARGGSVGWTSQYGASPSHE